MNAKLKKKEPFNSIFDVIAYIISGWVSSMFTMKLYGSHLMNAKEKASPFKFIYIFL